MIGLDQTRILQYQKRNRVASSGGDEILNKHMSIFDQKIVQCAAVPKQEGVSMAGNTLL